MFSNGAWYPDPMPTPSRLQSGGVLAPDGTVIPFAASCPPDMAPDPATLTCVAAPGTRNVNYECGGLLAPLGVAGCIPESLESPTPAAPIVSRSRAIGWDACGGREQAKDQLVLDEAGLGQGGRFFGCLLFAIAVTAAARALTGGRS